MTTPDDRTVPRRRMSLGAALIGVLVLVAGGVVALEAQLGAIPERPRLAATRPDLAPAPAHPPFQPLAAFPRLAPPTFDVVGIGQDRNVVADGSAAPLATVSLLDGDQEIGQVQADRSGQWAFSGTTALAPGGHELSLAERAADAPAGAPATLGGEPMMLAVPAPTAVAELASPVSPPRRLALSIRTASYDVLGTQRLSGRAANGAPLVMLIDGRKVGRASADRNGRWSVALARRVRAGRHQVQVQEIAANGAVLSAVETPLVRD